METSSIEQLCAQLLEAKATEKAANARRVEIEEQIITALGHKDEGSDTHKFAGFKVTITGKVTRKFDWNEWDKVKDQIPDEFHPFKHKVETDDKKIKELKTYRPELYNLLPFTVTPAKTAVEVKPIEDANA